MKKAFSITVAIICVVFTTTLILSAQNTKKEEGKGQIPANIMKVAERSCASCHTDPGNMMAKSHVNLSEWDKYSPEKQADKAKDMCAMVTKSKMPPKSYLTKHPDAALSAGELKALCDWAESIQLAKK
jgi:mono/diheme cytochrome c family protein